MTSLSSFYDARIYDPVAREYRTVTVPAETPPKPHSRKRANRPGRTVDRTGLSDGSPWSEDLSDTAYAPSTGWADMRSYLPAPAMRTHRPAHLMPAPDMGHVTDTGR